jgi:hypothetical protein
MVSQDATPEVPKLRQVVASLAERRAKWLDNADNANIAPPVGMLVLEFVQIMSLLAPLIGILPAVFSSVHVYWIADTEYVQASDTLEPDQCDKFIGTPRGFCPEPFAALSNITFWTVGAALYLLPLLTKNTLQGAVCGLGMLLALLGTGSMAFHDHASCASMIWQHAMDRYAMFAATAYAVVMAGVSLYDTIWDRVILPGDAVAAWSNVWALGAVMVTIMYQEDLDAIIMIGGCGFLVLIMDFAIQTLIFYHLRHDDGKRTYTFGKALRHALPSFSVRVAHLGLAFFVKFSGEAYFEKAYRRADSVSIWKAEAVANLTQAFNSSNTLFDNVVGPPGALDFNMHVDLDKGWETSAARALMAAADAHAFGDAFFEFSATEREEFRKLHDLLHGGWHFHVAAVLCGLAMTAVAGMRAQVYQGASVPVLEKIGKWENYAMVLEIVTAVTLCVPEAFGANSNQQLAVWVVVVVVALPINAWLLIRTMGLTSKPVEVLQKIRRSSQIVKERRRSSVLASFDANLGFNELDENPKVAPAEESVTSE